MHLKAALSIAALSSGVVNAFPGASDHHHQKPGPGDYRSPCPMLNTLANHNYIPRSGRNISIDQIVNGIDEALNLEPAGIRPVAELASTTSTTGIPGTMNLNDVAKHGVIEHDGSLSRQDASLGDNLNFDPEIFAPVAEMLFANETISIATAAQARRARLLAAAAANPQFNFTAREDGSACWRRPSFCQYLATELRVTPRANGLTFSSVKSASHTRRGFDGLLRQSWLQTFAACQPRLGKLLELMMLS